MEVIPAGLKPPLKALPTAKELNAFKPYVTYSAPGSVYTSMCITCRKRIDQEFSRVVPFFALNLPRCQAELAPPLKFPGQSISCGGVLKLNVLIRL